MRAYFRALFGFGIAMVASVLAKPGLQLLTALIGGLAIGVGASLGWEDDE